MNTTTIAAKNLRTGHVIVTTVHVNDGTALGHDETIRNAVTSDARRLGGTGLVAFGLTREGREPWQGRLRSDQGVLVENA